MTHVSCRVARPGAAAPIRRSHAQPSATTVQACARTARDTPTPLCHWLRLCGLDLPDSSYVLIQAAMDDYQRNPELRDMLCTAPDEFLAWWYEQDYQDWSLTVATASTDWAWLLLARAGSDVADSRFGDL